MKRTLILLATFSLTACASTGVIPKGNDTYTIEKEISRTFSGSPDDVRYDVYQEAANFCSIERQAVETIKLEVKPASGYFKPGKVFLEFRCK
jgi:hypothetical protein